MTRRKQPDLFGEKVENKSLNIKISETLHGDLQAIRDEARKQGKTFKLNGFVEAYLEELAVRARKDLGMQPKKVEKK